MPDNEIEVSQIAVPNLRKLQHLRPIYEQKFESTINRQTSVKIGIISFILSVLLHTAKSSCVKLSAKVQKMYPYRVWEKSREIKSRPVVAINKIDHEFLLANKEHPLMRKTYASI